MSDLIQWPRAQYWDKPWNPIIGCHPISTACDHCYAASNCKRFGMTFEPHETKKTNPPKKGVVFCGNMTDIFGDWIDCMDIVEYINRTLGNFGKANYLWLTKRPINMGNALVNGRMTPRDDTDEILSYAQCELDNQYFGITAENQEWYDTRLRLFREYMPFWANGWLSCEPLLGPIDLQLHYIAPEDQPFKWIVVGCESGQKRRPCDIGWVENIVSQAMAIDIPVFVKQLDINGKCETDITKFPKSLQIRQVPWEVKK